jgi:hypothetical protein
MTLFLSTVLLNLSHNILTCIHYGVDNAVEHKLNQTKYTIHTTYITFCSGLDICAILNGLYYRDARYVMLGLNRFSYDSLKSLFIKENMH